METIDVVIETPRGSMQKYSYEPATGFFRLKKMLPAGLIFPYDFGFIPGTKGDDDAPLDAIVLSEFTAAPGCLIECRLIGSITAEQKEQKKTIRNDRFIAVPMLSEAFKKFNSIADIGPVIEQLEKFFIAYNELLGKNFKPLQTLDPYEALQLIKEHTA